MSVARDDLSQPESDLDGAFAARPAAARRRGRALAVVVAVMVVAVLAGGWLVDTVGPAPQAPTHSALTQQVGHASVSVTLSTAPQTAVMLRVTDVSGAAVTGARAECALSMPGMAMSLTPIAATSTAQPGVYRCPAQGMSAGVWALDLTLTLPSGETDHATFSFVVA